MSSYLIFVLVLTAVYIIYYAVIITKDLYGKKDEAKTNEEVFDVSGMADAEESVAVEENDGGFSLSLIHIWNYKCIIDFYRVICCL